MENEGTMLIYVWVMEYTFGFLLHKSRAGQLVTPTLEHESRETVGVKHSTPASPVLFPQANNWSARRTTLSQRRPYCGVIHINRRSLETLIIRSQTHPSILPQNHTTLTTHPTIEASAQTFSSYTCHYQANSEYVKWFMLNLTTHSSLPSSLIL